MNTVSIRPCVRLGCLGFKVETKFGGGGRFDNFDTCKCCFGRKANFCWESRPITGNWETFLEN